MLSALSSLDLAAVPQRHRSAKAFGTLAVLGCLWLLLVNQLRLDWETNPQYSYGWLVPFLAGYLVWVRWPSRPSVTPLRGGRWLGVGAVLLAFALFPTRLVSEASPEWSLVNWLMALEVVGLTLAALAYAGGWSVVRHFAWPVCFILVGVAWPVRFENAVTQGLMEQLARLTAEAMNWIGVSAEPVGNLIRLQSGVVGVDEACSGVRSLQSMLMASIFLAELYRFPLLRRLVVIATGLALAVFFNIARALILVTLAVRNGIGSLERWHDPAGFSILLLSFGVLVLLVRRFRRPAPAAHAPVAQAEWRPLSAPLLINLALWLLATEVATEAWYRAHEMPIPAGVNWGVRWPESNPGFRNLPIQPVVTKILACNQARESAWQGPSGSRWQMFAFQWNPGRTSTLAARLHRPEVCLPAGGSRLVRELPETTIAAGRVEVPFRTYYFENLGRPVFVFFCLWEVGSRDLERQGMDQEYSRSSRLARVVVGQRNLGQQSVEVVVTGLSSPERAIAAFREQAEQFIVER